MLTAIAVIAILLAVPTLRLPEAAAGTAAHPLGARR
ncbi:Uncharacterised protein [Mycobacteroides abscessus subsp. abscessus]|nr:Uncharacterised protein [Mycobacteroides abscessus subsp. abscessus]